MRMNNIETIMDKAIDNQKIAQLQAQGARATGARD
jgi:hypothetical protein